MTTRYVGRRVLRWTVVGAVLGGRAAVAGARFGIRRSQRLPVLTELPPARRTELPGRGEVWVVDCGAPRPDAPTLLLFHGLAATSYLNWFGTLEDLCAHYRVVMFDQRWHGRGIVSERFRLEDCADDAAAVLDALQIDEAIVAGYSMGGALAQVFWRRHPRRTSGLVLASTAACWRANLGDRLFYPALGWANGPLSRRTHVAVAGLAGSLPDPVTDVADLSAWAWAELRGVSPWSLPEALGALGAFDARPWLGEIDVPTAVVVTARDRAIPTSRQRELAAAIPGARTFEAPGGHTSVIFDIERWRPVFLDAVAHVAGGITASARVS